MRTTTDLVVSGLLSTLLGCADPPPRAAGLVAGTPVDQYVQGRCGMCHGADLRGAVGPSLRAEALTKDDAVYLATLRDGRPGTAMPSIAAEGVTDAELELILCYLRGACEGGAVAAAPGLPGVEVPATVAIAEAEIPSITRVEVPLTNRSAEPVDIIQVHSQDKLSVLTPLPVRVAAGETTFVSVLLHVPNEDVAPGDTVRGTAVVRLRDAEEAEGEHPFAVEARASEYAVGLRFDRVQLLDLPARIATRGDRMYVAYVGGAIDVFEWREGAAEAAPDVLPFGDQHLRRLERIDTIAETPNFTAKGEPDPFVGRLVGGMDVGEDGTIYLTHTDSRMDEYTMAPRGAEADLSSGTLTRLTGPPGSYDAPGHRLDLVKGLSRNVDNHFPLGVAIRGDWVWFTQCSLTDGGTPDGAKRDPEHGLSGSVLRVSRTAPDGAFPIVLAPPGPPDGDIDDLVPGIFEMWATGNRNAFGLAWSPDGRLFLSDNSRDGGGFMSSPEGMVAQQKGWTWRDHLHVVPEGAFLGQPNPARDEETLEDGSMYAEPQPRTESFVGPVWAFGPHTGATGIAFVRGGAFPELDGWLLAAQFLPTMGHLLALQLDGDRIVAQRTLMVGDPSTRATDVAIGPHGEIVVAMISPPQLRIARGPRTARASWTDEFEVLRASSAVARDRWYIAQPETAPNGEAQVYEDWLADDERTTAEARGRVCAAQATDDAPCRPDDWTLRIEPDPAADDGFALRLRAIRRDGTIYSARLNTKGFQEVFPTAGSGVRVSARIKLPVGLVEEGNTTAAWPAFWALGNRIDEPPVLGTGDSVSWPCRGAQEVDVMEIASKGPDWDDWGPDYVKASLHHAPPDCDVTGEPKPSEPITHGVELSGRRFVDGRYHVFAWEWETTESRFLYDGVAYGDDNAFADVDGDGNPDEVPMDGLGFDVPMFLVLNLAVGGELGNGGKPLSAAQAARYDGDGLSFYVDWVRIEPFDPAADEATGR